MRIAALGDVHGNWPALRAVARDLAAQGVDAVIGLGDYLNTSLGAARVVAWLRRQPHAYFVWGDNDGWETYEHFRHVARNDPSDQYQFVNQLPGRIVLDFQGVTILAQHTIAGNVLKERGRGEETFRYLMSRRYIETVVDLAGIDVALFGGLHRQCLELHADLAIVHPGAVGARWPAQYALLELDGGAVHVTFRRAPYSRAAAIREMRAAHREDPGPDTWLAKWLYAEPRSGDQATPFERVRWSKSGADQATYANSAR